MGPSARTLNGESLGVYKQPNGPCDARCGGGFQFDRSVRWSVYIPHVVTWLKTGTTVLGDSRTLVDSRNRKQTKCEPVANIIDTVLRNCHGGEGQNARIVWTFWDRIVGKDLACNAQPAAFKQRILVVHVSSSAWLQELHFQKKELIRRLNEAAGNRVLDDIRFKIGPLPVK